MNAYSVLASKYDALMTDFDYDGYFEFIKKYLVGKVKGADMASGSGELTMRLAKAGKKVVGIDISEEMLAAAMKKARDNALNTVFLKQDIAAFELTGKVDFVTVCCDGVNYVKDIASFFKRVHGALKDGGVFIFDISTEYKLTEVIANNVFYEDAPDFTYLWTNRLSDNKVDMNIVFFTREGELYSRREESHRQYVRSTDDVIGSLNEAGFSGVLTFDGESFKGVEHDSKRALFIAFKK